MKKNILLVIALSTLFIACSPKSIDKTSPCACYDFVVTQG